MQKIMKYTKGTHEKKNNNCILTTLTDNVIQIEKKIGEKKCNLNVYKLKFYLT